MKLSEFVSLKLRMQTTQSINSFLYFFKRLPILKKVIPDGVYSLIAVKKVFTVIGFVLMILRRFITSFIAAVMCMPVAAAFAGDNATVFPQYHIIFAVICCLWSPILRPKCYNAEAGLYNTVRVMHMNAKQSSLCFIFADTALTAVSYIPAMLIMQLITGSPYVLVLPLVWYACRIIVYAADLFISDLPKIAKNAIGITVMLISAALGVIAILKSADVLITYAVICVIAAICVLPLIKYQRYNELIMQYCTSEALINQKNASKNGRYKMFELSKDTQSSIEMGSKSPAAYITHVFYKRHLSLMWRRPLIVSAIAVIMFAVAFCAYLLGNTEIYKEIAVSIPSYYKLLPFALYFMSSGENSARAMFYNCDSAMLRMPFYREPSLLLKVFTSRLLMLITINALPALLVGIMLSVINVIGGGAEINTFLMPIITLLLSVFFAVHHLSMYYYFQPYTSDLNVKNPIYSLVHAAVYIICFGLYQSDAVIDGFVYILAAATVFYIFTALLLVYKKAPDNFRIK